MNRVEAFFAGLADDTLVPAALPQVVNALAQNHPAFLWCAVRLRVYGDAERADEDGCVEVKTLAEALATLAALAENATVPNSVRDAASLVVDDAANGEKWHVEPKLKKAWAELRDWRAPARVFGALLESPSFASWVSRKA